MRHVTGSTTCASHGNQAAMRSLSTSDQLRVLNTTGSKDRHRPPSTRSPAYANSARAKDHPAPIGVSLPRKRWPNATAQPPASERCAHARKSPGPWSHSEKASWGKGATLTEGCSRGGIQGETRENKLALGQKRHMTHPTCKFTCRN